MSLYCTIGKNYSCFDIDKPNLVYNLYVKYTFMCIICLTFKTSLQLKFQVCFTDIFLELQTKCFFFFKTFWTAFIKC